MSSLYPIREVRIALTVESYEEAVQFYRDGLGLVVVKQWQTADVRDVILALGPHTTLELFDAAQAAFVEQLEVGKHVSGPVRLAFQVQYVEAEASTLQQAGAKLRSHPTLMLWGDRNGRIDTPDGMQVTLYQIVDSRRAAGRTVILMRHSTSQNISQLQTANATKHVFHVLLKEVLAYLLAETHADARETNMIRSWLDHTAFRCTSAHSVDQLHIASPGVLSGWYDITDEITTSSVVSITLPNSCTLHRSSFRITSSTMLASGSSLQRPRARKSIASWR